MREPLGVSLRPFQGGSWTQNDFYNNTNIICLFHHWCCKKQWWVKTVGAFAEIKEPNYSSSCCILYLHIVVLKKSKPFSLNVLDEAVKMINFIKSPPLSILVFDIYGKYTQSISAAYQNRKVVLRRSVCAAHYVVSWTSCSFFFFHWTPFLLERKLTNYDLFRFGCLADHFLENEQWACWPRKTDNICCWWIKFELSSNNRILEILYLSLWAWQLPNT